MESDEDLAHSRGDPVLGSPVAEEKENEESWSLLVFFLSERNMSSSESRRGAAGEAEEATEDPADTMFSA